jgi:aminoglycoside phosphotransferase (APT) family kinase protein
VIHVGIPARDYDAFRAERELQEDPERVASPVSAGPEEGTRILSVAGLRRYKGLSTLVDACQRLRVDGLDFECAIVGEGPLRNTLQRQIEGAGLSDRVRLAGAMTQGEVTKELWDRPIFALPSVVLRDGMMDGIPVALMEAMAAGAPVVASRISGIPELIEDGENGILVDPGDSSALAESIVRIARDPVLAHSLGRKGARKVRAQFSLDTCTRQLLNLIDRENPPIVEPLPPATAWQRHLQFPCSRQGDEEDRPYGVRILHDGRDSRVVEVLPTNRGSGGSLVVKVHADRPGQSRPAAERARHEYEVMASLTSRWRRGVEAEAGSGPVPRPVGLDQRAGLLVMEASQGRRLDDLLRAARSGGRSSLAAAAAAVERTGEWLRRFQGLTDSSVSPEEAVEVWKAELAENLERTAEILPARIWAQAESSVRSSGALTPARGFIPCSHHGDFWPGNVLVTSDGVQVVDFEGCRPGVAHEDLAYFLLQSELFFDFPLLRRRFRPLRSAFLRGYGNEDLPASQAYRACRMSVCLRLLAVEAGRQDCVPGPARRRRIHRLQLTLGEVVP